VSVLKISQELGEVAEALHGAAVVELQLQGRAPDEITGGWGHPAPPGPRDQRGHGEVAITVYGARVRTVRQSR
jgi:hypothetical protein